MAAFIGALDDVLVPEDTLAYVQTSAHSGGSITEQVRGLFNTASTFYNEDMARNFALVSNMAARLQQRASEEGCMSHNHAQTMLDSIRGTFGQQLEVGHTHAGEKHEAHTHDEEDDDEDEETAKKKKKNLS